MGRLIVKPSRDEDFYVVWSSVVSAPVMWGTKAEVSEMLVEDKIEEAKRDVAANLDRTEATGSSSNTRTGNFERAKDFIYHDEGFVPKERLRAFCESYDEKTEEHDLSLLLGLDEDEDE